MLRLLTAFLLLVMITTASLRAQEETTTLGGYGELHYNEPDGSAVGKLDFHRFVLFIGHSFNERLSFKSELELEHTKLEGGSSGGEVALEQAYLDYHASEGLGLRAGILLPPVGIINQYHEPPTFHGVERPNVERVIIPTTWREAGAGIYGRLSPGVSYQLYVVAGLRAKDFNGGSGIRSGRQEAAESTPVNPSLTGRIDYTGTQGLRLGGSFFAGNSTEGASFGGGMVTLLSGDLQYDAGRFSLRAVGATASIADAEAINLAYGNDVADRIYGFYVEGAYDVMPFFCEESEATLSPFLRYEKYNTQASVTGFTANPAYDRHDITVGATLRPTYNTAVKVDYQFFENAAGADAKALNLGIGYFFN